jgi:hypothetical protein
VEDCLKIQDADVSSTFADITSLEKEIDFKPPAKLLNIINNFVEMFNRYINWRKR